MQKEKTLSNYLNALGLKFSVKQDYNDNASEIWGNSNHYRVTLSREGRRMTFWFYQGCGIKTNPTRESVIECLASDRTLAQYTLKEFGDEFGWGKNTARDYRHLTNLNKRYERVIGNNEVLDAIYEKVSA